MRSFIQIILVFFPVVVKNQRPQPATESSSDLIFVIFARGKLFVRAIEFDFRAANGSNEFQNFISPKIQCNRIKVQPTTQPLLYTFPGPFELHM